MINRYTVGGAILLVLVGALWLAFGGALSAWSAGVYRAIGGNREAEAKLRAAEGELMKARVEQQRVLQEYVTTQAAVRSLSRQIMEFKQRSDQAVAAARAKDATIAQLREGLTRLERERQAQTPVQSLQEAKDALAKFHPAYR